MSRAPLLWLAVSALVASTALAEGGAEGARSLSISARVVSAGQGTAVISRGAADGLKPGDTSLAFHPNRKKAGAKVRSVDTLIRLARGEVTKLEPHRAEVRLRLVTEALQPGDHASYVLQLPAKAKDTPLLRLAALDVGLLTLDGKPLLSLPALLAGGDTQAMSAAMVAEVKARAGIAPRVYKKAIAKGPFRGKSLQQAFVATGAAEIAAFVDFVVAFPGKYVGRDWKLVNVYATWVVAGCPSGRAQRVARETRPLIAAAKAAEQAGELAKAEATWRRVLQAWPQSTVAKRHLERLERVAVHRRTLARKASDHATRWQLARELYRLRAHGLAMAELDRLEKAGKRVRDVRTYRARIHLREGRYAEALALFEQLAKERRTTGLDKWLRYARARAAIAHKTGSFDAHMAIARIDEQEGSYDNAQRRLRLAADAATTKAQLLAVRASQLRLRDLRRLAYLGKRIERKIRAHSLGKVRKDATTLVRLARAHKRLAEADKHLSTAADAAREVWERPTAALLQAARVDLGHDRADALRDLAWVHYSGGNLAAADRVLKDALKVDDRSAYAHHMAGLIALLRGDLERAAREARAAIQRHKSYPWPRKTLARVALARSRWDDGVEMALSALEKSRTTRELQLAYSGAMGLRAAAQPKASDKRSLTRRRLHALRLWLRLELYGRAEKTFGMLEGSDAEQAGCWAVLSETTVHLPTSLIARAAGKARPTNGWQDRLLTQAKAKLALADTKVTGRARALAHIDLARALVRRGSYHRALATLGARKKQPKEPDLAAMASGVARAAREGIAADRISDRAREARLRGGQWPLVARLQAEAKAAYLRIGAMGDAASAAFFEAFAIANQGKVDEALAQLEKVDKRFAGQMPPLGALDLRLAHAALKAQRGSLRAQREALEAGQQLCRDLDEEICVAQTRLSAASVALNDGRLGAARRMATATLRFAEARHMAQLSRNAIFQLADVELVAGNLEVCRKHGARLLGLSRKAFDANNERLGLMVLGAVAMRRGDAKEARARFSEVLALGRRIGETSVQATALLFLGHTALNASHDPAAAVAPYREAAEKWAAIEDAERANTSRFGLARSLAGTGQRAEAQTLLKKVVAYARTTERRPLHTSAVAELAWVALESGRAKEALPLARQALKLARSLDSKSHLQGALHVLGRCLTATGEQKRGMTMLGEAAKLLSEQIARSGGDAAQRGTLNYGRARQIYKDAIDALLKAGKVNEAMAIIELSRDASLRQMFDPSRIKSRDKKLKATLNGLGSAEKQAEAARKRLAEEKAKPKAERSAARIAALDKRVAESDAKVRRLLLRLKARHHGLYQAFAVDPRSLVNDRHHLPDDALVIAYFLAAGDLYIFTIAKKRAQAHAYKVPLNGADLGRTIVKYRRALEKRNPRTRRIGRKLYKWLIAPVEHELADAKTLLFMPAGPLYYLPMHALERKTAKGRRFLIEDHRVAYLLSTTVGELQRPVRHGVRARLAAFANPDGSLPGAKAEVERVKKGAYPSATVVYGKAADKGRVVKEAGRHHVLHFATHGILDPDPLRSHLKMARGKLTVDDIAGIEFSRETTLIVLSACQTALAVGQQLGEGISIAEAFATAGVPTLVASLWNVPDAATSELMVRFYAALKAGKGDTLDALRAAQLALLRMEVDGRRPYRHPLYWAGFELIGDYR